MSATVSIPASFRRLVASHPCPHCGNADPAKVEDNGCSTSSYDLTLLCVARVLPRDWAFTEAPEPDQVGEDGRVACGMQWSPNEG
jgi:hypothetical protein